MTANNRGRLRFRRRRRVQADIKTVTALGGYAATAKTGMLNNAAVIEPIFKVLDELAADVPLVVDPVMVVKGGARLLQPEAEVALIEQLNIYVIIYLMTNALLLVNRPNGPSTAICLDVSDLDPARHCDHAEPARGRFPDRPADCRCRGDGAGGARSAGLTAHCNHAEPARGRAVLLKGGHLERDPRARGASPTHGCGPRAPPMAPAARWPPASPPVWLSALRWLISSIRQPAMA